MKLVRFQARGEVVDAASGRGLSGLVVRAYDKDLIRDDRLGKTTTDEQGRFLISFNEDDFRDLFELSPDLYLRILDPATGEVLHQTEVRSDIEADEHFRIELDRTPA